VKSKGEINSLARMDSTHLRSLQTFETTERHESLGKAFSKLRVDIGLLLEC
jgi:hypothetical protein